MKHQAHVGVQAGFTLTEVMVGVGIVGILSIAIYAYLGHASRANARYERDQDEELVRQFIRMNLDCSETFNNITAASCGPGKPYIDGYDVAGKTFINKNQASLYGSYALRISCPVNERSLFVEAKRITEEGQPAVDPLTGKTATWFDPFRGIPPFSNPGGVGTLDFESVPGIAEGKKLTTEINDYFKATYGVSFRMNAGGTFAFAKIAKPNEPTPSFEAWYSIKCPKKPNRNQLCFGSISGGRWILSTTAATNSKVIDFEIDYATPVSSLKFDLADIDGNENWTFTLYNAAGNVVGSSSFSAKGYGGGTTNAALKTISLSAKTGEKVSRVRARGTKNIKIFGFGFDNFVTGIATCQAGS